MNKALLNENIQQVLQRVLPQRQVFRLDFITSEQALDKKKGRGLNGGNTAYARGMLNNDFIDNVRCRNLFTNTITFINSSNAVNMGAGSLLEKTSNQGFFGVAIGNNAGEFSQGDYAIAIGTNAGQYSQGSDAIAIGSNAGLSQQNESGIALGNSSGSFSQQTQTITIGNNAGYYNQQTESIAIGSFAGYNSQNSYAISIGSSSGKNTQQKGSISVGFKTGENNQAENSVAIGREASMLNAQRNTVCIGLKAGAENCETEVVSIGTRAGESNQKFYSLTIGTEAGQCNQREFNFAIGNQAGKINQGVFSEAIGNQAGYSNQNWSIAIGNQAGYINQGQGQFLANSIAIGNQAGLTNQHEKSLIINATSTSVNSTGLNRTFINPIREINIGTTTGALHQNLDSEIVFYSNPVKTFVIQHPIKNYKYLCHACIEGPTADVFYRGKGNIDISNTIIILPDYVKYIAKKFNVQISPIYDSQKTNQNYLLQYSSSQVQNGKFTVYGPPGKFSYLVHATREEFEVEPLKSSVTVKGNGPYTFIEKS